MNKTKIKKIDKKTLYLGNDISKNRHHIGGFTNSGSKFKVYSYSNSDDGFNRMWSRVSSYVEEEGIEEVIIGVESTANYGQCLLHYLSKKPVVLRQVNPSHSKRIKDLSDNSPLKNDKKDTYVIAQLLSMNHSLGVYLSRGLYADLRQYSHEREDIQQDMIRLYNRLEQLVSLLFPEFLTLMKLRLKTSNYLLRHYGSPSRMVALGKTGLWKEISKVSRSCIGSERSNALYEAALTSVGIKEGVAGIERRMIDLLDQIDLLQSQCKKVEKRMESILSTMPSYQWMKSVPGIGMVTCAVLLGELGDMQNFSCINQVLKYAGLNLYETSSGRYQSRRRISKRGRPLIRKILYMACTNMIRKGGLFYEKYQGYKERGKTHFCIQTALSKKLLTWIYTLVKQEKSYIENYESTKELAA